MGKLWSVGWRAPILFASMLLATELTVTMISGSLSPAKSEIFYQTGFEQPTFTPGPIVGQGGWAIYEGGGPVGSVSTTFPKNGAQSLRIDPIPIQYFGATSFRYLPGGVSPVFEGENRIISVKVEAALIGPRTDADLISVNFTPFLFFQSPELGQNDIFEHEMYLSSDGHVYFRGTAFAALLGQYNEMEARLDFPDQKTTFFLNGVEIGQESWATDLGLEGLGLTITEFTTPELSLVELGPTGNYNPLNYQGYFDDLEISTVPEPSSLMLLASGFLVIIVCGLWRLPSNKITLTNSPT